MNLKSIKNVDDLAGKSVILRASLNVPLQDGEVRNNFRLKRAVPTIEYLKDKGAKVIIVGHIGREPEETLKPVFEKLRTMTAMEWGGSITDPDFAQVKAEMKDGEAVLCENLRQNEGEKNNDEEFVDAMAKQADLYVNDAFAVSHREHASVFGLAKKLPAYAGLTLMEEVKNLLAVMDPKKPSLFLLGGAKFQTKVPLVEKYLDLYDKVFIGGAIANDVFKAQGLEVGESLVSEVSLEGAEFLKSDKLLLPLDVAVDGPSGVSVREIDKVGKDEKIYDFGPKTIEMLEGHINEAVTVLWNGPFGNYEAGFVTGTETIAKIVAMAEGFSVIGGGDTVASVDKLGLNDKFEFVSTGGGAMLAFLEHGTTPAIELLRE